MVFTMAQCTQGGGRHLNIEFKENKPHNNNLKFFVKKSNCVKKQEVPKHGNQAN
jgi:hypothetical protein